MTLPDGFQVRLVRGTFTARSGRLLVGGSPLTAMRLSERAHALLGPQGVVVTDAASAHLADRLVAANLGVPDLDDVPAVAEDELTVVVPVRDRSEQLQRALTGLRRLRCVVVDDASLDPERVAAVARDHGAELVRLPVNVGPAGARNAGLDTVTTPYVAFVDCDVEVTTAELTALARHFVDPTVSLVGPRVRGISRSASPAWFERYDAAASSLDLGTTPGSVRAGAAVAWLPSACLVARTRALGRGFDAHLRVGEDVDLVWRLVEDGHRVRYDPSVEARHDTRSTMRAWLGRKFVYGTSGAVLAARHGNKLAPAVLTPTHAAAAAMILLRTRWAVPSAAATVLADTRSIWKVLHPRRSVEGDVLATRLAVRGLLWAVRQESALVLRHWWPAMLCAAIASRQARTIMVSALIVDLMIGHHQQPQQGRDCQLRLPALLVGRRLDDLAYGTGLWCGAVKTHSARVLVPRRATS